jgi:cytoskeletal protein CcmA (bactofilin family)
MAAVAPKTNKEHDLGTSALRWGTVYSGDMNLDGNLTISGTVASIDVTTLVVNEEYIKVGDANAADILDLGLIAQYASDGTKYSVLFRDADDSGKWKLATGLTTEPTAGSTVALGEDTGATLVVGTFEGNLTGNVTGTIQTAAQGNITSVGTLTALQVDNINVDANTITASTGALNLTPAAGSAIVLDGTINVDAGVVTGATSITSTDFVGDLTGDVTGNASGTALTVTQAAQTAITSVGTLTALQVDNVNVDGSTISTTNSDGHLILAPDGDGEVQISNPVVASHTVQVKKTSGTAFLVTNDSNTTVLSVGTAGTKAVTITGDLNVSGAITGSTEGDASLTIKGGLVYEKDDDNTGTTINLDGSDHMVVITGASGAVTVNLPAVASHAGREYILVHESAQTVTLAANASEAVYDTDASDLLGALTLNIAYRLICSGDAWYRV